MPADTDVAIRVQTRACRPDDAPFLRALFASHCTHFLALGLPQPALETLLDQQYAFQQADYSRRFPNARKLIALVDEAPVGHMTIEDDGAALHLVDIAVAPSARRCGYGCALVQQVQQQACATGRRVVTLSVDPKNQAALHLYQALGFETVETHPVQWRMAWYPHSRAVKQSACSDTLSILITTKG